MELPINSENFIRFFWESRLLHTEFHPRCKRHPGGCGTKNTMRRYNVYRFDATLTYGRQIHGPTDCHKIYRTSIASCGKNY